MHRASFVTSRTEFATSRLREPTSELWTPYEPTPGHDDEEKFALLRVVRRRLKLLGRPLDLLDAGRRNITRSLPSRIRWRRTAGSNRYPPPQISAGRNYGLNARPGERSLGSRRVAQSLRFQIRWQRTAGGCWTTSRLLLRFLYLIEM